MKTSGPHVHRVCLTWLAAAVLASCAVGPNYHRPDVHMPAQYAQPAQFPTGQQPPPVDVSAWWRSLHDPLLESLIDRAVKANPDLQIALDRLQAARTYEIAVIGTALPDLQASGAAGRGTGSD